MQRMHVGLKVSNIGEAVAFYSKLFGAEPDLLRSDYAKWMLDDPFVNFSVDLHGDGPAGSAHFGLQQLDAPELAHARQRLLLLLGLRLLAALQLGAQLLVLLLPRDGLRERLELPGAVADDGVHLLAVGLLQRLRDASLARVFLRGAGVARRSRPGGPR